MQKIKYYCDNCGKECTERTIRKIILDKKETKTIIYCDKFDLCRKCFVKFEQEKGKLNEYYILNNGEKYYTNF